MRIQPLKYWDRIRSSFWFVPSLMVSGAIGLSVATVSLDEVDRDGRLETLGWAYGGGAEGASVVLGTIAGSMVTIAGVVFSMTLVVLSLAASQLGPRLLRNFMRDTANQVVLGTFLASFVYCLLVLRTIRRGDEDLFVPHLSVTVGVLFALASLAVLIYYIHHVSVSIQADQVIARVGRELLAGVDRLFPEQIGHGRPSSQPLPVASPPETERVGRFANIPATGDGYLQLVDAEALMELAAERDVVIHLEKRPGHYIIAGTPVARIRPRERVDAAFCDRVCAALVLGSERTNIQDIEFAIQQLVEIAVRALSPGVNDPLTAVSCVDRLGSALHRLAGREMPSPDRYDDERRLRLISRPLTFAELLDSAFVMLRIHSGTSVVVTVRLLETITAVAGSARRPADRAALRRHAELIIRGARTGLAEPEDRRVAEECFSAAYDASA